MAAPTMALRDDGLLAERRTMYPDVLRDNGGKVVHAHQSLPRGP